jgi:hypothetical protein
MDLGTDLDMDLGMDLDMDLDKGGDVGSVRRTVGCTCARREAMLGAPGNARKRR